jgi:hypothetical protein
VPAGWRDRDRADRRVIVLSLETLEDVLHLRHRNQAVLAPEAFRRAPPQVDAHAVRLDMAVGRRVIDGTLSGALSARAKPAEARKINAAPRPRINIGAARNRARTGGGFIDQTSQIRKC